jgi:hypothetical protein
MKLLSAFGITSSITHIRDHGNWWAKIRKAIKEIDIQSFWRVTFDNLDFKMKFAKKISAGGDQLKRMLHLLTSQVTFRRSSHNGATTATPPPTPTPPTVITLQSTGALPTSTTKPKVTEKHFKIEHENSEWLKFNSSTFHVSSANIKDDSNFEKVQDLPLLDKLQKHMSNWTPEAADKVVYTTVDEAHSGSVHDVGKYLSKLKEDLCIGKDGYSSYVILGGDQQTYAHMKNF